jgi:hypothetical protein
MNKEQYLLICLAEECTEVGQRCTKALRFGLGEIQEGQQLNNAERLALEITDLTAVLRELISCIDPHVREDKMEEPEVLLDKKKSKIQEYMEYSKKRGIVK